jgi:serine protease AprX
MLARCFIVHTCIVFAGIVIEMWVPMCYTEVGGLQKLANVVVTACACWFLSVAVTDDEAETPSGVAMVAAETKISPAFEQFMAESGLNDRREALVVYRAPTSEDLDLESRPREPEMRRDLVEQRSDVQKPVEEKLIEDYQSAARDRVRKGGELAVSSIGSATLPVVVVEVTRRTLSALAAQPEVVAIIPNQKVRLIEPTMVDYGDLARSEVNNGMTWGLERLGIADLWEITRGQGISVAVLDTGVYSEHAALDGRVKGFVIIDPLGRHIKAVPMFDGGRHGTHVCGTIAGGKTPEGVAIGVAPAADLLVAGVLVGDATVHTLVEGISWAVENGADIINMSLSFSYYEPLFSQVFDIR